MLYTKLQDESERMSPSEIQREELRREIERENGGMRKGEESIIKERQRIKEKRARKKEKWIE